VIELVTRAYHTSFHVRTGDRGMVAFNRVRCTVLAVSELKKCGMTSGAIVRDVLPWADPYVAQLIKKLQDEVRMEREQQSNAPHNRITGVKISAA
jgi:hypothetical protein